MTSYCKRIQLSSSQMEGFTGQVLKERTAELPCPLWVHDSPSTSAHSNPETLRTSFFWVYMEASSRRNDRLNQVSHWWSMQQPSASLASLGVRRWGWKFQPSNHMVGSLETIPPAAVLGLCKNHLININWDVVERGLLWITKHSHLFFK